MSHFVGKHTDGHIAGSAADRGPVFGHNHIIAHVGVVIIAIAAGRPGMRPDVVLIVGILCPGPGVDDHHRLGVTVPVVIVLREINDTVDGRQHVFSQLLAVMRVSRIGAVAAVGVIGFRLRGAPPAQAGGQVNGYNVDYAIRNVGVVIAHGGRTAWRAENQGIKKAGLDSSYLVREVDQHRQGANLPTQSRGDLSVGLVDTQALLESGIGHKGRQLSLAACQGLPQPRVRRHQRWGRARWLPRTAGQDK